MMPKMLTYPLCSTSMMSLKCENALCVFRLTEDSPSDIATAILDLEFQFKEHQQQMEDSN